MGARANQQGFTIIEVLVTLIVVSLFLYTFFQSYLTLESQRVNVARQAIASDVAYTNLRKITSRPAGLTCDPATMDLTSGDTSLENRGKSGVNLFDPPYNYPKETNTETVGKLGTSSTQTLAVYAPNGCTNFLGNPLKIVSTVTYGTNGDKVVHASYIQNN
jgi:prepilin-type N-terminal cleavage/methylation domain-containing protein